MPTKAVPKALLRDVAVDSSTTVALAPTKILASKDKEKATLAPAPVKVTACVVRSVSANTAAESELAAVDGLSPKLARAIMRKRPLASLDDLNRVKGISAKLLASIRSSLKL